MTLKNEKTANYIRNTLKVRGMKRYRNRTFYTIGEISAMIGEPNIYKVACICKNLERQGKLISTKGNHGIIMYGWI